MGKQRLTNDREVHLEAHKLEELEAVHVRHVDIADHKVKLVLLLPQQLQGRGRLSSCCHCGITNPDRLARIQVKAPRNTLHMWESNLRKNHSTSWKVGEENIPSTEENQATEHGNGQPKICRTQDYRNHTAGGLKPFGERRLFQI